MNFERYPWLADLSSSEAKRAIEEAKVSYKQTGAVTFPDFLSQSALDSSIQDAREQQSTAFTTDDVHTAYLRPINQNTDPNSVENHEMRTQVASIAFDELPKSSTLAEVYRNPSLRELVARIVGKQEIYLSEDPLGCCSINVFRPRAATTNASCLRPQSDIFSVPGACSASGTTYNLNSMLCVCVCVFVSIARGGTCVLGGI